GIAMCFANAGFPITIVERAPDILERGLSAIKGNYNQSVMRGRLSPEQASNRSRLITGSILPTDLSSCDLIIEAVFERMDIKQDVFATLDRVAKPDAILATNTSYLDVNTLAQSTTRPDRVLGMHFFSPANIMKLLEIVRGDKTAKTVLATAMRLAKQIGKVGVVVGVGPGFVGNRMLFQRTREAQEMILEGATPWEIDRVLTDFGFPMGPFQMSDLAGLDLGWVREESKGATLRDRLNEIGRHGQKSGAGYYDYVGGRKGIPSAVTEQIIRELMALKGATPRKLSDQEILQRSIYPMINEAANILLEGKALRASDIDVVWLNGYGWPAYRGGPTYYADRIGLSAIVGQIRNYGWAVSPLLEKLGEDGKCFADLSA
ncbi:MAG TPA: 3-hydroxyacyl-CoA dehydrogenase NAD-binding domain-containing protein, partial [Rhizomicrobium sp.]|nr:3-hydroxyacyl-CoA dehydrogenase NAD-binding domain-containing protein [Rhizomicrobium sp.]